jgi:HlyD family secretion protein
MSKHRNARRLIWPLVVAVLAGGVGVGWYFNQPSGSPLHYETAAVTRGELTQVVTASGQLNPLVKVDVGSQISGIIQKLVVDFNASVTAGQVIAQLDAATYEANLIQAQGNLANAKAAAELAQLNAERAKTLQTEKLNAKAEYEKAVADLHQAEAAVKVNEGSLIKAQVDLARCTIYAPIDGIVISRNVNVGQTVAASLSAPTLFVIANDLAKMQIEADVAEADIGLVGPGQEVEFTVDAFPGQTFHGKVTQVRYAPKADQNVVTYVTIIDVTNPNLKLKPGMTANVSVIVTHRDNVLKIPNAALRFRPPRNVEMAKPRTNDAGVAEAPTKSEMKSESDKKSESAKVKKDKKDKRKSERTIYVLRGSELQPVKLKLGITDGRETELVEGLQEGDAVIVDISEPKESTTTLSRLFTSTRK